MRDKDAPASICLICEIAAWAKDQGKTLYDILMDIYMEYGFTGNFAINVVKPGKSGADEIKAMMEAFRNNPPKSLAGSPVVEVRDFKLLEAVGAQGNKRKLNMPEPSNVLQWFAEDGTKVSVRPSGTEPKIKFYMEIPAPMASPADYDKAMKVCESRMEEIKQSLGL